MIGLLFVALFVVSACWIIDEWGNLEAHLIQEHRADVMLEQRLEMRFAAMNAGLDPRTCV